MFSYEVIQQFTDSELSVYKYIVDNFDKIPHLTIRELSEETFCSTATILRFCNKLGFEKYSAFKDKLREESKNISSTPPGEDSSEIYSYFNRANTSSFEDIIAKFADKVKSSEKIFFIGLGSSGSLARYAARYYSNLGMFAVGLEDQFYPISKKMGDKATVIALSVSGETKGLVEFLERLKKSGCNILSITNRADSTIARMSDMNIAYNLTEYRTDEGYNYTTQVPVMFLIEAIARRV